MRGNKVIRERVLSRFAFFLSVFLGFSCPLVKCDDGQKKREIYLYIDFQMPLGITIDVSRRKMAVYDVVMDLKICAPNERFICFSGATYKFAIPKNGLSVMTEWEYGGDKYVVLSKHVKNTILGKRLTMSVIRRKFQCEGGEGEDVYYYSEKYGLLMIDRYFDCGEGEDHSLYISDTLKGFGALPEQYQSKSKDDIQGYP